MKRQTLKTKTGMVLMAFGAILLIICRLTGWQTNTELLISLALVVTGYILHIGLQRWGEKY